MGGTTALSDRLHRRGRSAHEAGTKLGDVQSKKLGRPNAHGARMTFIKVKGTNGARYYGRLNAEGQGFCLLRKAKDYNG